MVTATAIRKESRFPLTSNDETLDCLLASPQLGFDAKDTNLTRYVGNSVTNAVDPTGNESCRTYEVYEMTIDNNHKTTDVIADVTVTVRVDTSKVKFGKKDGKDCCVGKADVYIAVEWVGRGTTLDSVDYGPAEDGKDEPNRPSNKDAHFLVDADDPKNRKQFTWTGMRNADGKRIPGSKIRAELKVDTIEGDSGKSSGKAYTVSYIPEAQLGDYFDQGYSVEDLASSFVIDYNVEMEQSGNDRKKCGKVLVEDVSMNVPANAEGRAASGWINRPYDPKNPNEGRIKEKAKEENDAGNGKK